MTSPSDKFVLHVKIFFHAAAHLHRIARPAPFSVKFFNFRIRFRLKAPRT